MGSPSVDLLSLHMIKQGAGPSTAGGLGADGGRSVSSDPCVGGLTFHSQLHGEALGLGQRAVRHHAADVFAVVGGGGDQEVLADHRHRVVSARLGHRGGVAVGGGHPGDEGLRAAVCRLAPGHHGGLGAGDRRHRSRRVLRLGC